MIVKKLLQLTSNDVEGVITLSCNTDTKKITLVAQGEDSNDILPLGNLKDEHDPTVNVTLLSGTGIDIGTDNSININTTYLKNFVGTLGYLPVSSNMDVTVDLSSILMDVEHDRKLSVNPTWLDNVIDSKGFALAVDIPTDNAQLANGAGYLTGVDLSDYAHLSDIPAIPVNVSVFNNDAQYATSAYVTGQVAALATGTVATNTADIAAISADYTTSAYVTDQVNDLATGAVATNTASIDEVSGKVEAIAADYTTSAYVTGQVAALADGAVAANAASIAAIAADYLKAADIAEMATTGYVTGQVAALATGAVAINTADIATVSSKAEAIAADYTTSAQVANIVEDYGYVTTDTTYEGSDSIIITSGNNIAINSGFLEGFVANLGYLPISSNMDVTADEDSIIVSVDGGRVLSVSETWVNGIINGKGFLTEVPVESKEEISGAAVTAANAYTDDVLTGYAQKSELPTSNSGLTNDAQYATSAYVTEQVNALADGAVAANTTDINGISSVVSTITTDYLKANDIAQMATTSDVTTAVNALANGAVATNTTNIETISGKVSAIEANYATSAQVSSIVEGYGYITGIENNALLSDIPTYTAGEGLKLEGTEFSLTATIPTVPTNVSDFANDAGYLTEHQSLTAYAQKSEIPTKASDLANDKNYATFADVEAVRDTLFQYLNTAAVATYTTSVPQGGVTDNDKNIFVAVSTTLSSDNAFRAKNVTINELDYDTGRIGVYTDGDATIKNVTNSGTIYKTSPSSDVGVNVHSQIHVEAAGRVVIADSVLNENGYNAIEIGLTKEAKSVLIDNVTFSGTLTNNAISIYKTVNDAVVTISNCKFKEISNAIRLSNYSNTTGLVVNIVNCDFEKWEGDNEVDNEYTGMILCQECTAENLAAAETENRFSPDKITINIINCRKNGNPITFSDPSDVCGSKDANQLMYVFAKKDVGSTNIYKTFIEYEDGSRYPKLTCV